MFTESKKSLFAAPILHLIAHIAIVYAVFSYRSRVSEGHPIHPASFNVYSVIVFLTSLYVTYQFFSKSNKPKPTLLTLYIPLLAGLSLQYSQIFGSALFSPYGNISGGEVLSIMLLFAVASVMLALAWDEDLFRSFAALSANIVGGFFSITTWVSLPQNGEYLGWASVTVPENAWDVSYSVALFLINIAIFAPIAIAAVVAAYKAVPENVA